ADLGADSCLNTDDTARSNNNAQLTVPIFFARNVYADIVGLAVRAHCTYVGYILIEQSQLVVKANRSFEVFEVWHLVPSRRIIECLQAILVQRIAIPLCVGHNIKSSVPFGTNTILFN
ncbi:hypothetical protein Bhyg_09947, partial [Pseudolycoriella hygida]